MIARYTAPLLKPIHVPDHWQIAMFGGTMSVEEKDGLATALVFEFTKQPVDYAPHLVEPPGGGTPTITANDIRLSFLRRQLREGIVYLQAMFQVEIDFEKINAEYIAENDGEKERVNVSAFSSGIGDAGPTSLSYDLLSRAMIASEKGAERVDAFYATMATAARGALFERKYIDSFRFSFLLIDYLCGNGKIKKEHLKQELMKNGELVAAIEQAQREFRRPPKDAPTATSALLEDSKNVEAIVDHIVDQRGFYFHASSKRKDGWKPQDQKQARDLAWLGMAIVHDLGARFSAPMFDDAITEQFISRSKAAGALTMVKITFDYRDRGENFDRKGQINLPVVGTKVTLDVAAELAKGFFERFTHGTPGAGVRRATAVNGTTGAKIFEIQFFEEAPPESRDQADRD